MPSYSCALVTKLKIEYWCITNVSLIKYKYINNNYCYYIIAFERIHDDDDDDDDDEWHASIAVNAH